MTMALDRRLREPYRLLNLFIAKTKQAHEAMDVEREHFRALVSRAKDHLARTRLVLGRHEATLALLYKLLEKVEQEAEALDRGKTDDRAYRRHADAFSRTALIAIRQFDDSPRSDPIADRRSGGGER